MKQVEDKITLGKYTLKEVFLGDDLNLEVYKGDEYIVTFTDADVNTFDTEEELEEELKAHKLSDEEFDPWGNVGEGNAARHDMMVDALYC